VSGYLPLFTFHSFLTSVRAHLYALISRQVVPRRKCSEGTNSQRSSDSRKAVSSHPPIRTEARSCSQSCNRER